MKRLMRTVMLMGFGGGAVIAPSPLTAARAEVRCCLPVILSGIETERPCTAVVLRAQKRRPSARRLCRLAGGRPLHAGGGCTCP